MLWHGKATKQPGSHISQSSSKHERCYTILTQEMEGISLEPGSFSRDSDFCNKTNSTFMIDFAGAAKGVNQCSIWACLFINNSGH